MIYTVYNSIDEIPEEIKKSPVIYVLELDNNMLKIGRSNKVYNRISAHIYGGKLCNIHRIAISKPIIDSEVTEYYIHKGLDDFYYSIKGSNETYKLPIKNSFDYFVDTLADAMSIIFKQVKGIDLYMFEL